jgi:glutathione peroxidase
MKTLHTGARIACALAVAALAVGLAANAKPGKAKPVSPLLNRTVKNIDGKNVSLDKFQGRVLLIVNTASLCGNTPQYAGLEQIYKKYHDKGFDILAFPANNFGSQEPGTDGAIKEFCTGKYDVTFPLFSKISVKGADQAPLYRFLTDKQTNPRFGGDIEWNFAKFLVNRNGEVVNRFPAGHKPTEPDVIAAIEAELARK